ncbi:glucokinase [Lysobacter sp. SG-8]|uniref:Glucokinase n=2 Tax=Marilutibacter penaei TaxID=2759900 RepID=A0A7W3U148_9GAMM|nr:glucokinase [Lysobacter penaei]
MPASLPRFEPCGALLADIGGTNARFALASPDAAHPDIMAGSMRIHPVAGFASLAEAASHYLAEMDAMPRRGVFAVAGPIEDGEARITNHPWTISATDMRDALGLDEVELVNDFTAQAMAVTALATGDTVSLGGAAWGGLEAGGDHTYAVLGAGTGLGVGGLLRRDGRYHPLQTEGGHSSFAPCNDEEIEVLRYLAGAFPRVSNERLLSGSGLVNLHRALSHVHGRAPEVLEPRDITARAAAGDPACLHSIEVFCAIFGAVAGDLALTLGAWDGVFLTGGLVPRLMPWLPGSAFRSRFEEKGRLAPALSRVPAIAVVHHQPGLLGAAAMSVATRARDR